MALTFNSIKTRLMLPVMASSIADLLQTLNADYGMSYDTLHLVGHSMGAHLSGFVGKRVIALGKKIGTIIGLDTSSSCVSYTNTAGRLASTDAVYVESVHASSPFTGFKKPIGMASFYVNGAATQDLCQTTMWSNGAFYLRWVQFALKSLCSHTLATNFYADSLMCNDAEIYVCDDYQSAMNRNCGSEPNKSIHMGAHKATGEQNLANTPPGIYYVKERHSFDMIAGRCAGGRSSATSTLLRSMGFVMLALPMLFMRLL